MQPLATTVITLLLLLLLLLLSTSTPSVSGEATTCQRQLSTCACETAAGVIDLSPLSSPSSYPFSDSVSGGQDSFQWSPCLGQLCGNQFDTAVCETYSSNKLPVGLSDSAKFVTDPARGLQLVYTDTRSGVLYTSHIVLVCDPAAEKAEFSAEGGVYDLYMHLRSKYACPGAGGGGGGGGSSGVSTGDVLCIVLIVGIFLYLCGGLLINKFAFGKDGAELVPNKDFWTALPGYIKEGCLFTASKLGCRKAGGAASGYEPM